MDVLRRLEIDQDEGPEHGVRGGEADHQPKAGRAIRCRRREPRSHSPDHRRRARVHFCGQYLNT